jgi:hypothetical protein
MIRSLFVLAAATVLVGAARSDDLPGPKITFPDVKGLTRDKPQTYPKAELGYSVGYKAPGFTATVYVYNMGLAKIPDGIKSDEVKDELKRAAGDIDRAVQAGLYKSAKEVGKEETVTMGKGKGAPELLRRRFELEIKDTVRNTESVRQSEVYVTGYKNHFVKVRITHEPDDKTAPDKTAALLAGLGGALK